MARLCCFVLVPFMFRKSRLSVGQLDRRPSHHSRESRTDEPVSDAPVSELILRRATAGTQPFHNRTASEASQVVHDELDYSDTAMIPAGPHAPAYILVIKR